MSRRRILLQLAFGLATAAGALWLTYRSLDLDGLSGVLAGADWKILLLVLPFLGLSYVFRIVQWQILLSPLRRVRFSEASSPLLAGFMVNSVLPARIGEVVRALLLSRRTGVPRAASLATVALSRVFDGLTLTAMSLAALATLWGRLASPVRTGLILAGAGYVLVLAFVVAVRIWRDRACALAVRPLSMLGLHGPAGRLEAALHSFADGLAVLKSLREVVAVSLLALLIWSCLAASVVPVFIALSLPFEWYYPALVLILAAFGMLVPTPAGTGTVHAALTAMLPAMTDLSHPQAGALALVFHVTQFLPVIAAGLIAALHEGLRARDVVDGDAAQPGQSCTPGTGETG